MLVTFADVQVVERSVVDSAPMVSLLLFVRTMAVIERVEFSKLVTGSSELAEAFSAPPIANFLRRPRS